MNKSERVSDIFQTMKNARDEYIATTEKVVIALMKEGFNGSEQIAHEKKIINIRLITLEDNL